MKYIVLIFIFFSTLSMAQSVQDIFVQSSNLYLDNKTDLALQKLQKGINLYPNSEKLQKLKETIEEEGDKNNQQKGDTKDGEQPKDDNQEEQDSQDNQQNSNQQDGDSRGERGTGSSEENPQNANGKNNENQSKKNRDFESLQQDRLLKALKEQEQNTQRRLMMGKSKQRMFRNQKDW